MEKALSYRDRRNLISYEHKRNRAARFASGIYGCIKQPDPIETDPSFVSEPPTFHDQILIHGLRSVVSRIEGDGAPKPPPVMRCFYSGVTLLGLRNDVIRTEQHWLESKDHLVPVRRSIDGVPHDKNQVYRCSVQCANIINYTFGAIPLMVRLVVRRRLRTIQYDRTAPDDRLAYNLRWTIINMLEEFRYRGRYPWARDVNGNPWFPECVEFMERMWVIEQRFLDMTPSERDEFCRTFVWQF